MTGYLWLKCKVLQTNKPLEIRGWWDGSTFEAVEPTPEAGAVKLTFEEAVEIIRDYIDEPEENEVIEFSFGN